MQHSWRPAIHRCKLAGGLLAVVLLATAVIGTLRAQFQGTLQGTPSEVVLYAFKGGPAQGSGPFAGVVRDGAGNLYGTTESGGPARAGVVFRVDPTGHETVLYSFYGGADGAAPQAGVIGDSAGNLYGTTASGGGILVPGCAPFGCGVVFKLDTAGRETVLYSFSGGADGAGPSSGVIRDSAGNLYGTTQQGGITAAACFLEAGCGVVYKIDPTGHETVLYSFTGGPDGGNPSGSLIRDSAGNLYGTTQAGGSTAAGCGARSLQVGCGVVYKLDATGHYTVLYTFTGGADGGNPYAGVIGDGAGNLYGTTASGGITANCPYLGCGVVFKLDAAGHETVLHSFMRGGDGESPQTGVVRDRFGNLYGTTYGGGITGIWGTVFKVDPTGHETLLYSFTGGADGSGPLAGVIGDGAGNLYGTTASGGIGGGVVYKLDPTGHETVLYSFPVAADDGFNPRAGVIGDGAGNLYGTTSGGGAANAGIVYKLDAAGHETVLHTFTGPDGGGPEGGVVRDSAGNLYGTTGGGGTNNGGTVFKLDPTGHETVLFNFSGGLNGAGPQAGVIGDSAGNLYGTTTTRTECLPVIGCFPLSGTVFKLDPVGVMTVLNGFENGVPSGVIRDSAGNLYATASAGGSTGHGLVVRVDPAGNETVLYNFTGGADGGNPLGGVVRDSAGNLYGTTSRGGMTTNVCGDGCGVVFKLGPTGTYTVLYSFTGGADGDNPQAGVIGDSAGNLYGTTSSGGIIMCSNRGSPIFSPLGCGVVFKLDPAGHETVLHSFTGGADGANPYGSLIPDSAGNLYGTTANGGPANSGVVYRIKP
jgi:uncharacterized repeat protein (TIGR03803 family)